MIAPLGIILEAEASNRIRPGGVVVEGTAGNTVMPDWLE